MTIKAFLRIQQHVLNVENKLMKEHKTPQDEAIASVSY